MVEYLLFGGTDKDHIREYLPSPLDIIRIAGQERMIPRYGETLVKRHGWCLTTLLPTGFYFFVAFLREEGCNCQMIPPFAIG